MQCVFSGQRHLLWFLFWEVSYGARKESWSCRDLDCVTVRSYQPTKTATQINRQQKSVPGKIRCGKNQTLDVCTLLDPSNVHPLKRSDCIREKPCPRTSRVSGLDLPAFMLEQPSCPLSSPWPSGSKPRLEWPLSSQILPIATRI